jgi:3-phosphoshikimate 1-carboxyvinyltransferase
MKESDRVRTLARGFDELGIRVEEKRGGLRIWGGLRGRTKDQRILNPEGDHRMAMVFLLLGKLKKQRIRVLEADCVVKSWPGFGKYLRSL